VNVTAMLFSFGMFGAIFFLSQFLQTVQGYSPLSAGLRVLPWTGVMMLLAPLVGVLINRVGAKPLVVTGLMLQAPACCGWPADQRRHAVRRTWWPPFVIAGVGMTLFFVPLASLVLGSVPTALEGVASGTNSAFRELGGVLGIAVLGAVFSSSGGYPRPWSALSFSHRGRRRSRQVELLAPCCRPSNRCGPRPVLRG
jgi:predicted MFS family arabinose efflux permease